MQLSHDSALVDVAFDEANLVSCAGLAPVLALAERAGLSGLLTEPGSTVDLVLIGVP